MENNKRITKAMRNEDIIAILQGETPIHGTTIEDAIAHLTHENALLAKKNSGDAKKPTKVQLANEEHKADILAFLATKAEGVTATEVMTACNLASNQKAASLLKSLVENEQVRKMTVKGKSLFILN